MTLSYTPDQQRRRERSGLLGGRGSGRQDSAAVPGDTYLAVVAADDLVDLQVRKFLSGRLEQLEDRFAAPGGASLEAGAGRGDQLAERVSATLLNRGHPPVVRHRVRIDEAIGWRFLAQRDGGMGEPPAASRQRAGEDAARCDPGCRPAEWVRPGLVDRAQLLRIALDKSAGQGEVRVHPDEHAARVGPAAEGAPDDNETLGVLRPDRVEQLVPAGPAGL